MTAEIGMLNKYAVALAADSAVTVSGNNGKSKVYNSANKLFLNQVFLKFPAGNFRYKKG
jgi:hypothetical protein